MSNRLTFSLASLIVIFAFGIVAMPVMAQNAVTVTIEEYAGVTTHSDAASDPYSKARNDFRVRLTFSHPVEVLAAEDVQYRLLDTRTGVWTTSANVSAAPTAVNAAGVTVTDTANGHDQYVVTVDASTVAFHTEIEIIVGGGVTRGTTPPNDGANTGNSEQFALPPLHANAEASFGMPTEHPSKLATYNVDIVFTNTTATTPAPATEESDNAPPITAGTNDLTADYINVSPNGANLSVGVMVPDTKTGTTAGEAGTSTYTVEVQLLSGVRSVTLSLDPAFSASSATMGTVTIPTTISAPSNVTAEAQSNGDIDVSWAWSGTAADLMHFALTWDNGGSATITDATATSHTIGRAGLTPGTPYTVSIMAVATSASGLMNSAAVDSNTVTALTPQGPAAPAGFTATADDDDNTITLAWTNVAGLTYEVTKSYTGGTDKVFNASSTPALTNPLTIPPAGMDPLPQGVEFTFSIKATDSDGLVSAASTDTVTLKMDVQPTVDISTLSYGANSVTVRFTFAEATMVEGSDGSAVALNAAMYDARPVPTSLAGSMIKVTTDAAGMNYANIAAPTAGTRLNNPNVFDVTIDYTGASLPLYVTLDDAADHVSAISTSGGDLMFVSADSTPALMLTSSKTATIDIPSANSSSERIPLGDYTIQPYDFFVLVRDIDASGIYAPGQHSTWVHSENVALPDLDWFFGTRVVRGVQTNGGTIALHGPAGETAKDLVFSEVMWGTDSSLAVDECSQWIEFYNATPAAIDLSGYEIQFHRSQVPASRWSGAIDVVSNVNSNSPYFAPGTFPGQSGRSNVRDTQGALGVQTDIVSMYRHLDEPRIRQFNVANRGERNKGIGGWNASRYPTANISPIHIATPGAHQIVHVNLTATNPNRRIIINEIGNSSNDEHDWIELYNTTNAGVGIENWELTRVYQDGSNGKEVRIARLPKVTIPANSYVVLAASHPNNDGNDLAAGIDLAKGDADQRNRGLGTKPTNTTAYYLVNYKIGKVKIENNNTRYLYILRNHHDRLGSAGNVEDVVGTLSIAVRGDLPSGFTGYAAHARQLWDTATWPLQKWGGRHGDVNRDDGYSGHGHEDFRPGFVYQRSGKNSGIGEHHIDVRPYTGVGYDRHAAVNYENGGTPGYSNGSVKAKIADVGGTVSISEIMVVTHEKEGAVRTPRATRLPQWIELYNSSLTQGVSLHNWYFELLNAPSEELGTRDLHGTLRLPNVVIPPNQTVLIVSSSGLDSGNFPEQRVINLFTNSAARSEFNLTHRDDPVLSEVGFYIELRDPDNKLIDKVGNLNVVERRGGLEPRDPSTFDTAWDFMTESGKSLFYSPEGYRTSLLRIYDNERPRSGVLPAADGSIENGIKNGDFAWMRASTTNFRNIPSLTYYGNHRDYGTPGYRGGGPLPVQLATFRPERLDDGTVVIRWITESELNNAGFNILRSEDRAGEFTKINTQLIAGNGTTSERNAYEFTDKSAKPNVVYYYQIQDVSVDGDIQTLRVSRLKGHVTPSGKVTTTWGKLKALQ